MISRHHGRVTATPAWPSPGPAAPRRARVLVDGRARPTRDSAPDPGAGRDAPRRAGPRLIDGRGVFVRREPGPDGRDTGLVRPRSGRGVDGLDPAQRGAGAVRDRATASTCPAAAGPIRRPAGRYSPRRGRGPGGERRSSRSPAGPVHLVGNSYGGVVATLLAARRPDLVRTLDGDLTRCTRSAADPRSGCRPAARSAAGARHGGSRLPAIGLDPADGPRPWDGRAVFRSSRADHRRGLRGCCRRTHLARGSAVDVLPRPSARCAV